MELVKMDPFHLRVLLCFINNAENRRNVSGISRALGETVKRVSRAAIDLEEMGLVDRKERLHPRLTEKGLKTAEEYAHRINLLQKHYLGEGADMETALYEAFHAALNHRESTIKNIEKAAALQEARETLQKSSSFDGNVLCENLPDGTYHLPFVLYSEKMKDEGMISPGYRGFAQPCELSVCDGKGTFMFRTQKIEGISPAEGLNVSSAVSSVKYSYLGGVQEAEIRGDIILIRAGVFSFFVAGSAGCMLLHGSLQMKIGIKGEKNNNLDAVMTVML